MSETLQVELDKNQRELLLRGLRFVRSSRMLEFRDPPDEARDERAGELVVIQQLSQMLAGSSQEPAQV